MVREDRGAEEEEEEGLWLFDVEVSDWRVCSAAIWVGSSERRVASMAEGGGGVSRGRGRSIRDVMSEEERSRVSHSWRSVWRLQ